MNRFFQIPSHAAHFGNPLLARKAGKPPKRSGVAASAIYAFIAGWNEYTFAMVFINTDEKKTVSLGIGQLIGEYRTFWNELMAGSFFALVPMLLIFIFFNRYLVSGLTAGAVKE